MPTVTKVVGVFVLRFSLRRFSSADTPLPYFMANSPEHLEKISWRTQEAGSYQQALPIKSWAYETLQTCGPRRTMTIQLSRRNCRVDILDSDMTTTTTTKNAWSRSRLSTLLLATATLPAATPMTLPPQSTEQHL
jgi:hypothetical protein